MYKCNKLKSTVIYWIHVINEQKKVKEYTHQEVISDHGQPLKYRHNKFDDVWLSDLSITLMILTYDQPIYVK